MMRFAAASLVERVRDRPAEILDQNVQGPLSLLQAMRSAGHHRIVFSSTGAVYGNADSKARRISPARRSTPTARRNG
ncbi:UDP-glucose 4-epimerase [Bradyrhizobium sp. AZCC 2230]